MKIFYFRFCVIHLMKKMAKSIRKHIRREKARIRREVLDIKKQEESINELREKFLKKTGHSQEKKHESK